MALHALPADWPELHTLTTACPCQPELRRVVWRGMQRDALYHRLIAPRCTCGGDWRGGDHVATCPLGGGRQTGVSAR